MVAGNRHQFISFFFSVARCSCSDIFFFFKRANQQKTLFDNFFLVHFIVLAVFWLSHVSCFGFFFSSNCCITFNIYKQKLFKGILFFLWISFVLTQASFFPILILFSLFFLFSSSKCLKIH